MSDKLNLSSDVVIIGAGLAGLAAAELLTRSGYDVIIVEGRDRVGGRVKTINVADTEVDAGAAWVGPHHTAVRGLASRMGVRLIPQYHSGKSVLSFDGKRQDENESAFASGLANDLSRVALSLETLADAVPVAAPWEHPNVDYLESMSFGEWLATVKAAEETLAFFNVLSLVHWGAPVTDVSLLNVIRYIKCFGSLEVMLKVEGGDQQDRIEGTAQGLIKRFADSLDARILLNAPVEHIITNDNGLTVQTPREEINAQFAIITASPAHRSFINFTPPLPEQYYGLARAWRLGALSKAFVAYGKPFWREDGLSGESVSDNETVFLTFDVSPQDKSTGILMAFCDARGFDGFNQEERQRRVVEQLVHLYGERAREITDYADFSWGNDTFAAGGPNPAVGPGAWRSFGRYLSEPVGRVHWAGTETAHDTSGTMNGAILSGLRAAEEVTKRLGPVNPR